MMAKFLISLILFLNFIIIFGQNENIALRAIQYGFDLSDPNNIYFHDICVNLEFYKKDITLDYRRKFHFFPGNKKIEKEFQRPLRKYFYECFFKKISFYSFFQHISLLLFAIFLIQFCLIIKILLSDKSNCFENTPNKKLEKKNKVIHNKNKVNKANKENKENKSSYIKFTPEEKKDEIINNKLISEDNNIYSDQKLTSTSSPPVADKNDDNNKQNQNSAYNAEQTNENFQINTIKEENELEEEPKQNNIDGEYNPKIKSTDNYTFGITFGTKYNFNNNNEEPNDNIVEKKDDKLKRIKKIYEEINPIRKKIKENKNTNDNKKNKSNDINNDVIFAVSSSDSEKKYVREEYFYFKYLLARIEDKRSLFQIYYDLLEQNQIIFKFFYSPLNIYEDRVIQIIYYLTRINLYFLVNILFIKSSVINDIYDEKNNIIYDFFRSLKTTIITYFIGLFLYKLTNIKKVLIKRRYHIINLKIGNRLLLSDIIKLTLKLCNKLYKHKIKCLFILVILITGCAFYLCFCFCIVYPNTEILLLKCIIISFILSETLPFIFCFIPAFLRKKSLDLKMVKLYDLTKIVEFFFIP